jgi:hypothetical protein
VLRPTPSPTQREGSVKLEAVLDVQDPLEGPEDVRVRELCIRSLYGAIREWIREVYVRQGTAEDDAKEVRECACAACACVCWMCACVRVFVCVCICACDGLCVRMRVCALGTAGCMNVCGCLCGAWVCRCVCACPPA